MIDILEVISGSWILIGLTTASGVCSLIAIYFGFRSISPRLVNLSNSSIIFFGSILEQSKSIQEFREHSHRVLDSPLGLDDDLAGQIYINARIAAAKFRNVSSSIRYFIISFLILLTEMVLILLLS
nr:Pycsar system effector family protein [Lewinella sp. JB7]